ncbi:hypothetical protein D3C71_2072010 [compost metagenome]
MVATVDGFHDSQLNRVSIYVTSHAKSGCVLMKVTGGTRISIRAPSGTDRISSGR